MRVEFFLLMWSVLCLSPCLSTQDGLSPNVTVSDLTFKNMDFAMDLYRKISGYHDNNIFFSPLCLSTVFTALSLGARGATRDQILKGLNLHLLQQPGNNRIIPELFQQLQRNITQDNALKFQQSMGLFVGHKFVVENEFINHIQGFFGADINTVDFRDAEGSLAAVNEYVMKKTDNKVKQMVSSIEPLTQLMLVDTIFFKGAWELPFNPNNTEKDRFYIDKYNIIQVPMMFKEDEFYNTHDKELKVKVLRLPYVGGSAMLIILPNADVDYTEVDEEITATRFLKWIKALRETKLEVRLPKFKMGQSYAMQKILPSLGITDVFGDNANLTGLSKAPGLQVSEVLHKAVIEVDERGTVAAAATTVGITAYSLPTQFIVNRPFFFLIYHESTNSLMFMGRVIDPSKY
ncbi:protein Z-dependent protease inhibitor [Engraulis encrasicolus]|uniref:protein Z-dependent protease inhibitor n=1 Tax=Engraulis encrasicolus TaxID=184585 RepID=UPI002FD1F697